MTAPLRCIAMVFVLAAPAHALTLPDGAELSAFDDVKGGTLSFPVGPYADGEIPKQSVDGAIRREAWVIPESSRPTLDLLAPLEEALKSDGFNILFSCVDTDCGGFDFRYALDLLPEPDMHVDLGDFRYLAARKSGSTDVVTLTVSRSGQSGFIHVTRAGPRAPEPSSAPSSGTPVSAKAPVATGPVAAQLASQGKAILDDLAFATGSSELEPSAFPSLSELAEWLKADESRRIVLVGHSDAVGDLSANIALSRNRARSVLARLRETHGVPDSQLSAEGIGFLAPRASNDTDDGRALNRRVEAVIPAP